MTHPRLRLGVAIFLFLGWIGYLTYLVVRTREPVIVSRPQLLHSDVVIVAEVEEKEGAPAPVVKVKEVLWAAEGKARPEVGQEITLREIVDVLPHQRADYQKRGWGWHGPGDYLIPLQVAKDQAGADYGVTPMPWSPGLRPLFQVEILDAAKVAPPVAKWIVDNTRVTIEELNEAAANEPFVLRRNLELSDAMQLQEELDKVRQEFGDTAASRRTLGEYRIYLATRDAREQVKRIKGQTP